MKWSCTVLFSVLLAEATTAFVGPQYRPHSRRSASVRRATTTNNDNNMVDLYEFDYLLREGSETIVNTATGRSTRRVITLGTGSQQQHDIRSTVLVASTATMPGPSSLPLEQETSDESDPYADALDSQLGKIQQYQERQDAPAMPTNKLKQMDLQDIIITFFIPGVVLFAAGRWGYNRVSGRVRESADATLDAFSREMIYHDGDFKEMELCVADYNKRLLWMPTKRDAMLKRYLEAYAKRKTVSPQALASLSYVFTIFKLSEEQAAHVLVSLCRDLGTDKISSSGKLLFMGSRILKSPQGVQALQPIKDMIKSTYRDAEVAETLVETSQQ